MLSPDAVDPAGAAPPEAEASWRVLLVTGLSGAGKTTALKALEDVGYEAVDNLPLSMLCALVRDSARRRRSLAVGIDIRTRDFGVGPVLAELDRLRDEAAIAVRLLFLDCDDEVIARRFTETRRRHPLAADRAPIDGIRTERHLLLPLRDRADLALDTSLLSPHDLRRLLQERFRLDAADGMSLFVTSFSYRRGLPREADLVFDMRFLRNPHYVAELRDLTGREPAVGAYIEADPGLQPFLDGLGGLLDLLLPRYQSEGKSYLTIAFGCTGGKHRSVYLAERLAARLQERGMRARVVHRELDRAEAQLRQDKVSA